MLTDQSEKQDNNDHLVRLRDGDEKAFIQVYNQYRSKIYTYAYTLVKSTDTAEEIVQQVFIKIWQKKDQINPDLSFSAYLKKITLNHVLNYLKKISREKTLQEQIYNVMETGSGRADDNLLEKELRKIYADAIEQLPPQKKLIYQLSRTEELSHEEIALKLNISKNTVKNHMVEATKGIRAYVSKNGGIVCLILASSNYFHSN